MVDVNTEYLKNKKNIEKLDKCHHKKILDILQKHNINFSENRNGIFINMNLFNKVIINDITKYLNYVKEQEKNLYDVESLKQHFKKIILIKKIKKRVHIYKMNNITNKQLNKYFLNNENIYSIIEKMDCFLKKKKQTKNIKNDKLKQKNNTFIDNFYVPSELYKDSLFWCWIIFNEGLSSYSFAENYIFKIKNQKKIELIQILRDNKDLLKKHKIKISEIENNLLYEENISLNTLRSILLINSFNFVYITR